MFVHLLESLVVWLNDKVRFSLLPLRLISELLNTKRSYTSFVLVTLLSPLIQTGFDMLDAESILQSLTVRFTVQFSPGFVSAAWMVRRFCPRNSSS